MKTSAVIAALLSVNAVENTKDNTSGAERSVWVSTTPTYKKYTDVKTCTKTADCKDADSVCAQHNWTYNNQFEGMRGCWHKSVCKNTEGTSSFNMFDGRKI